MIHQRREKRKDELAFWKRIKISELGLRIVLIAIIIVGGFAYLVLTTTVATRGLQVKDLSDRLEQLSATRAVLQADVDRLQSMQRLSERTRELDLVRVSTIDYIPTPTGPVAAR